MKSHQTNLLQKQTPPDSQLQHILHSLSVVIVTLDRTGKIIDISNSSFKASGYSPEELIDQYIFEFAVREQERSIRYYIDQCVSKRSDIDLQTCMIKKDGTPIQVNWILQYNESENLINCILQFASERENLQKAYQEDLEKKLKKTLQMLDHFADGFFTIDKTWKITSANSRVEDLLGLKREDYLDRNYWDCFPGMVGSVYHEHYQKAMDEMVAVHFDGYFKPFDRWLAVDAYPSDTGLSIFFRDITDKKKAEEELLLSNERFRLAAKSDAIYDWDISSNIVHWGEGLSDLFGYVSEELQMDQWESMLHPDDAGNVVRNLMETLSNKDAGIWKVEYRMKHKNGIYCYVFERGQIVRDHKGVPLRIVGVMQDISERKLYEEKIEQQNKQMISILERMNQGFFSLDRNFTVHYWNRQAEEIIGVSREEVLGKVLLNWYCKEAQELYASMYQEVIVSQMPFHSEHICPQNGKWVEVSIYPADEGFSVFFRDIDRRKRAEQEMLRLSLLAKKTSNGVVVVEPDSKISWVNEAYLSITGYSIDEVLGKKNSQLLPGPETSTSTLDAIGRAFQSGSAFKYELLTYTSNKESKWLEIDGQPLKDANGEVLRYFVIHTDITERKELELALQEQQKKVNAAVIATQERERTQVGRELHDNVNQVLTSVKLYQELCLSGIGNQQELIRKSAVLLQESINEIRSLSKRLSAPTLGSIKLKDSVKELVDTIAATNRFEISLDTEVVEELDVAEDLHLALYRILQEHFTNILKYANASEVHVTFDIIDNNLTMKVTDNGVGFSPRQKSNGIGITNMKTRAESMNGNLHIDSAPGKGCILTAVFPMELE